MKTNPMTAQPKFTDFLSSNRESIRMTTLCKSSLEVIGEMLKVVASSNDPHVIYEVFDCINRAENDVYNILYNYEHRKETEAPADLESDMADN